MRAVTAILAFVLILGLAGWLQFGSPDNDPNIRIDTDKIKQDTSVIVDKAKDAADEIDRRVDVDVNTSPDPEPEVIE